MKSVCTIDLKNTDCWGYANSANDKNSLHLHIYPLASQFSNYRLEITDIKGSISIINVEIANDLIEFDVPESYFNGNGLMKMRLLSNEANSDYVLFNTVEFGNNENIRCVINEETRVFTIKKIIRNNTGVPIATTDSLGVIKVGATLNVKEDGTLNANEGEGMEAITNTELEALLT